LIDKVLMQTNLIVLKVSLKELYRNINFKELTFLQNNLNLIDLNKTI